MNEENPSWWQRRVAKPLMNQLTQGVTPEKLAFTCAAGAALGVFPILGSTTLLCLMVGVVFKLNQPAIQTVNYLVYPFQIGLIPMFVRMGEKLYGAQAVPFMPTELVNEFLKGPSSFLSKYGWAGLYGISAWALLAPFFIGATYIVLLFLFRGAQRKLRRAS